MTVVAAVIEQAGLILIGQRPRGEWQELKWEFPGGKVEPLESPPQALKRELEEELGIDAVIGPEITRYPYQYPGKTPIELIFFRVNAFVGAPQGLEFERIVWEEPDKLPSYDFLDGDIDFVRGLARGEY